MPTITQLEYLIAVDKERHFGKAAKRCHVSQPSLSAQIQKLEDELEVIIFDRSKKPIVVSEIGKEVVEQAKIIISEVKKIKSIATCGNLQAKGEFHLAVIPTIAPYLLPLFLARFSKANPKVNLKVSEEKTEDIIRLLADEEIDAGLLVTPLEDENLIEKHLFYEPFYCYICKDHPFLNRKFVSEDDLTVEGLWLLEEGHCFRNQVLNICSPNRGKKVLPNVEFESGDLETLKNLIKRSSGYTLLPELAVNNMSAHEVKGHIRGFKKPIPTREISLVYSHNFYKDSILAALEKTILETLPPQLRTQKRQSFEIIEIN
ncbi:MAG: LysR substrate-binding domain-containing protein [Bdellovibrionota bacterium]